MLTAAFRRAAIVLLATVSGCNPGVRTPGPNATPSPWGPLAVYVSDARGQALAHGTLRLEADCVLLAKKGGGTDLLAWPHPETTWDAAARRISLTVDGEVGSATFGDFVTLGGGGKGASQEGLRPEESTEWIWPPAPECLSGIDRIFFVSGIVDRTTASAEPTPAADYGPLAVFDPAGSVSMDALGTGTIVITETCAFLEWADGRRDMLAWPQPLVAWDRAADEIVVESESRLVRLSHGENVQLGGGSLPSAAYEDHVDWITGPHADCATDQVWFASGEIVSP